VNPATFEVTRLSEMGMFIAKTTANTTPVIFPAWLSRQYKRTIPTMETAVLKIMSSTRALRRYEARKEVITRKTISTPPLGSPRRIDLSWLNPIPWMMRGWNWVIGVSTMFCAVLRCAASKS
jgi:hypothetical protein